MLGIIWLFINILAGVRMAQHAQQFYYLLFGMTVFCTIIGVITEEPELTEESSIIDGETTDVIETNPTNELKEDGNDLIESALALVGNIISNWFTYDVNQEAEGKNEWLVFIEYETDVLLFVFKSAVLIFQSYKVKVNFNQKFE